MVREGPYQADPFVLPQGLWVHFQQPCSYADDVQPLLRVD